jgi:hypothetical protein
MLHYHVRNPAGAVESLKEVIVTLVLQLHPVKVPLREIQQPSDVGVDGIRNDAKEINDLGHEIWLALWGEFPSGNLYIFVPRSDRFIAEEFPAAV